MKVSFDDRLDMAAYEAVLGNEHETRADLSDVLTGLA